MKHLLISQIANGNSVPDLSKRQTCKIGAFSLAASRVS